MRLWASVPNLPSHDIACFWAILPLQSEGDEFARLRNMAVLVTGERGYIGSHMVLALLESGEDVLVLDNLSTGFRWADPASAEFIEGDVGDHELVHSLMLEHRVDAVTHFAGSVVVPESVGDPLLYYRNNTCHSRSLIACAVEAGVPYFIFSSSAAVYGTHSSNPVGEDTQTGPTLADRPPLSGPVAMLV
jgi:UDP-glucose 4-epimerase